MLVLQHSAGEWMKKDGTPNETDKHMKIGAVTEIWEFQLNIPNFSLVKWWKAVDYNGKMWRIE